MLAGKRILIVEDEPLIGLDLESAVKDCDGIVVGIVSTVAAAKQAVEIETLHGAILSSAQGRTRAGRHGAACRAQHSVRHPLRPSRSFDR